MEIECVTELTSTQMTQWDTFMSTSEFQHPRQYREFAEADRVSGVDVRFILGLQKGEVVAVGLLSLNPHPFLKGKYRDAIFLSGPVADSVEILRDFLNAAFLHPSFSAIGQVRVTPYWMEANARLLSETLENDGWKVSTEGTYRQTGLIDIEPEPEEIMARFSKSARREVRRAERAGVSIKQIADRQGAAVFLDSLNRLRVSRGLKALDADSFFQGFEDVQKAGKIGLLLGAFHEERFIGGLLMYRSALTAHGRHFTIERDLLHELKNLRISPLLWLKGMTWARDQGCGRFDVEGYVETSDKADKKYNIYKYKSELAPRAVIRIGERSKVSNVFLHLTGNAPRLVKTALRNWKRAITA